MCCVGKRLPLNHLTMLCCHVAYLGKVFFVDRSGVVNSVLKLLFISLCRRKRRLKKKKCFVLSFHCCTMFIFFTPSDGGCVTLFTLAITIKESCWWQRKLFSLCTCHDLCV